MKTIHLAAALAALPVFCGTALARNPQGYDGTWRNDNMKSSWSDGHYPKGKMSLTIEVSIQDGHMKYHSINDTMKSRPAMSITFDAPMDGKAYPLRGSSRYDEVRVRPLENNEIEILEMKGDDLIVGAIWQLEDGGKTLMRWGVGKSPAGKSKAYQEFFTQK